MTSGVIVVGDLNYLELTYEWLKRLKWLAHKKALYKFNSIKNKQQYKNTRATVSDVRRSLF